MPRGIGYIVVQSDRADTDEPHDWALLIEEVFRRLLSRFAGRSAAPPRENPASGEGSPED